MTNQTPTPTETLNERVVHYFESLSADFRRTQAKLIERIELNPSEAIEWEAAPMFRAQAQHEVALHFLAGVTDFYADPAELVAAFIRSLEREVRYTGGSSTNQVANVRFHAEREAKIAVLESLERFASHYAQLVERA